MQTPFDEMNLAAEASVPTTTAMPVGSAPSPSS